MSLLEFSTESTVRREAAAAQLHRIADMLERHNEIEFTREGMHYSVAVPDEVTIELDLELGDDGNELEIEITWK